MLGLKLNHVSKRDPRCVTGINTHRGLSYAITGYNHNWNDQTQLHYPTFVTKVCRFRQARSQANSAPESDTTIQFLWGLDHEIWPKWIPRRPFWYPRWRPVTMMTLISMMILLSIDMTMHTPKCTCVKSMLSSDFAQLDLLRAVLQVDRLVASLVSMTKHKTLYQNNLQ